MHTDSSKAAQADSLASAIADRLCAAIEARGVASIAFSGGSTPKMMFAALAKKDVDWSKVVITLVDERCVDESNPRSNARLLRENLLDALPGQVAFFPLYQSGETAQERAERLGEFPLPFDVVHLGMGTDAHTASFFPDAPNIAEMLDTEGADIIATTQSMNSQEERITWTLSALLQSRQIYVQLCGAEKLRVIEPIIRQLESSALLAHQCMLELPILAVLQHTTLRARTGVPAAIYYTEE